MKESVEDRIIAYFDGRLTDDESAELLHRVSISPEIRRVFREHEMLREMARTAQSSVVVRPEVEASLFARIEAIAESERTARAVPPLFLARWRRSLTLAAGVVLVGAAAWLAPGLLNDDQGRPTTGTFSPATSSDARVSDGAAAEDRIGASPSAELTQQGTGSDGTAATNATRLAPEITTHTADVTKSTIKVRALEASAGTASEQSKPVDATLTQESSLSTATISEVRDLKAASIGALIGGERGITPVFNKLEADLESMPRFEATLETSTGFVHPANEASIDPLSEVRLSLGYRVHDNIVLGVRGGSGNYLMPQEATQQDMGHYIAVTREVATARYFNVGGFVTGRMYSVLSSAMMGDLTLGAGWIPEDGYAVSLEAGLKIPVISSTFVALSAGLTRVHSNATDMQQILDTAPLSADPVMVEGSDVKNTLVGRIHVGLTYQF